MGGLATPDARPQTSVPAPDWQGDLFARPAKLGQGNRLLPPCLLFLPVLVSCSGVKSLNPEEKQSQAALASAGAARASPPRHTAKTATACRSAPRP